MLIPLDRDTPIRNEISFILYHSAYENSLAREMLWCSIYFENFKYTLIEHHPFYKLIRWLMRWAGCILYK